MKKAKLVRVESMILGDIFRYQKVSYRRGAEDGKGNVVAFNVGNGRVRIFRGVDLVYQHVEDKVEPIIVYRRPYRQLEAE